MSSLLKKQKQLEIKAQWEKKKREDSCRLWNGVLNVSTYIALLSTAAANIYVMQRILRHHDFESGLFGGCGSGLRFGLLGKSHRCYLIAVNLAITRGFVIIGCFLMMILECQIAVVQDRLRLLKRPIFKCFFYLFLGVSSSSDRNSIFQITWTNLACLSMITCGILKLCVDTYYKKLLAAAMKSYRKQKRMSQRGLDAEEYMYRELKKSHRKKKNVAKGASSKQSLSSSSSVISEDSDFLSLHESQIESGFGASSSSNKNWNKSSKKPKSSAASKLWAKAESTSAGTGSAEGGSKVSSYGGGLGGGNWGDFVLGGFVLGNGVVYKGGEYDDGDDSSDMMSDTSSMKSYGSTLSNQSSIREKTEGVYNSNQVSDPLGAGGDGGPILNIPGGGGGGGGRYPEFMEVTRTQPQPGVAARPLQKGSSWAQYDPENTIDLEAQKPQEVEGGNKFAHQSGYVTVGESYMDEDRVSTPEVQPQEEGEEGVGDKSNTAGSIEDDYHVVNMESDQAHSLAAGPVQEVSLNADKGRISTTQKEDGSLEVARDDASEDVVEEDSASFFDALEEHPGPTDDSTTTATSQSNVTITQNNSAASSETEASLESQPDEEKKKKKKKKKKSKDVQ